jgi:hypothetical protein
MFARAYSALSNAREERKSTAEITEMVGLWEALVVAKETRYPAEAVTAVCQNALACIVLEFFGSRHPRGARTKLVSYFFSHDLHELTLLVLTYSGPIFAGICRCHAVYDPGRYEGADNNFYMH